MEKIKNNKILIIITSILILLPSLVALLMWDRLPELIPTHWNFEGNADKYSSKLFAFAALPAILLGVHALCIFATAADPKNRNINNGVFRLMLFISPAISVIIGMVEISYALGREVDITRIMMLLLGMMFIIIGNYLPKSRRNYTMGIKIPWTLNSDNNWNATHRVGGIVFIAAGLLVLILAFIPGFTEKGMTAFVVLTLAAALLPMIYSFLYYLKNERNED